MKRILVVLLSLIMVVSFIGCGSSDSAESAYDMNYAMTEETESMAMDDAAPAEVGGMNYAESDKMAAGEIDNNVAMSERKIIKSASMEIQTLEYDIAVQRLNDKIIGVGGYIESSNVRGRDIEDDYSTRSAHFTLRVPQKQFEQFMTDMTNVGTVIQSNTYGEDVTAQIFDHEAHKKTLEIQEERLLDILGKAEKIEDVISLERELSNVRYQIENLTGTLKRLENLVSYSTLSISIYEVHEIVKTVEKPKTLAQKISAKFSESLEDISDFFEGLAVWAIGSIPLLVIYIPLLLIVFLIGRKVFRTVIKKPMIELPEEKKES